jgi:hypothetical protein
MKRIIHAMLLLLLAGNSYGQTDIDGLMMQKKFFCIGPTAGKSSWKNYWEGTRKRDNQNLGRVSTTNYMLMGNYGVTDKLNVMFSLPYVKTRTSAGQLAGQKGLQDCSFFVKWVAWQKHFGKQHLKAILIGGYSLPTSDYTADLLPLSIGLRSKNVYMRLMADVERGNWFATISGTYIRRSNINLDRNAYYTTEIHYTNEVKMPDAAYVNLRAGWRSSTWIVEAIADNWTTLGGFDITRNNMPFVSNKMNATKLGLNIKYDTDFVDGLSFTANAATTVAGRNAGQSTGFNAGVFYIIDFSKKNPAPAK